ncbi:MAG: AbrB/MazE/SpoVT family DNA-binding domain-containing protein [Firmicutes bacterium]|nr:AbrB/MazE/SpoVT family DNA-binding domain-containing protein [Bacillota bacterium]
MAVMMNNEESNEPNKPESVGVDDRGRISLPKAIRKQMGIEAGDILFMQWVEGRLEVRLLTCWPYMPSRNMKRVGPVAFGTSSPTWVSI